MASKAKQFGDKLYTMLSGLSEMKQAYNYHTSDPSGYPAITVEFAGHTTEQLDEISNKRVYNYNVRVFLEMNKENLGIAGAEDQMRETVDEIIDLIEENSDLDNTALNALTTSTAGYSSDKAGVVRIAEFVVSIEQCADIS